MEFYGYKKCSTCREAYQYLKNLGFALDFQDFVQSPPSVETLRSWVMKRGDGIAPFINAKGTRFRDLDLKSKTLSEEEWFSLLSQDGKLIKRPVVVVGEQVLVGFDRAQYDAIPYNGGVSQRANG